MPLPRGHSLNSSVIQDAPAVMPFTMQAAPATLGFSAKLVTTKPQSLSALPRALRLLRQRRKKRGKQKVTGGREPFWRVTFLSGRFDGDVGATEITRVTLFEIM